MHFKQKRKKKRERKCHGRYSIEIFRLDEAQIDRQISLRLRNEFKHEIVKCLILLLYNTSGRN